MRIIAFVGSPIEDNEKDVSSKASPTLPLVPNPKKESFSKVIFLFLSASATNLQLVKMAKRLKKEKVNVDIINFGEEVRKYGLF